MVIDSDQLLYGECTLNEIQEFFRDENFDNEYYVIAAIERHLLTDSQRNLMQTHGLSIEKMLNGRCGDDLGLIVAGIFRQWNEKLGFSYFGDRREKR